VKKSNVVSFGKYFAPYQRARKRAGEILGHMKGQAGAYVFIPPEIDPFAANFEEEVTRILFESELLSERNRAKEAGQ
jgi:hypothetical protein